MPIEIFIGKGLLTFVSVLITMVILLFISGNGFAHGTVVITASILTSIFGILIGMIIGLLAQNQMATGVIGTPIYMLLMLVPLLAQIGSGVMLTIGKFLPTFYLLDMIRKTFEQGKSLGDLWFDILILAGSVIAAFIILLVVYRKKGLE